MLLPKCYTNTLCKSNSKGEKLLCAHGRAGQTQLPFLAAHFAKRNTKFGGGGKIGIGKRGRAKIHFPQPPFFLLARAFSFCSAKGGAISQDFVQNRFELRSVIATNSDILKIQRRFVARKKPCPPALFQLRRVNILELNRKVGQNQIQFFGKANGGSACKARNKQSLFPIFSFPPEAEYKANFLIPRFCAVGAMVKGD